MEMSPCGRTDERTNERTSENRATQSLDSVRLSFAILLLETGCYLFNVICSPDVDSNKRVARASDWPHYSSGTCFNLSQSTLLKAIQAFQSKDYYMSNDHWAYFNEVLLHICHLLEIGAWCNWGGVCIYSYELRPWVINLNGENLSQVEWWHLTIPEVQVEGDLHEAIWGAVEPLF